MRDAAPLVLRQLGGADVHAAVDLHRVGVDDLAAEALGEVEGEVGLAGRGGPDDRDDRRVGRLDARPDSRVTPTLSVEAVQLRLHLTEHSPVAVSPVGADGDVVSPAPGTTPELMSVWMSVWVRARL